MQDPIVTAPVQPVQPVQRPSIFPAVAITFIATSLVIAGALFIISRTGAVNNIFSNPATSPAPTVTVAVTAAPAATPLAVEFIPSTPGDTNIVLPKIPSKYIPAGLSPMINADGSLNITTIQNNKDWDQLQMLAQYGLNSYLRTKTTGFQIDGSTDSESYSRTMVLIDNTNQVVKQGVYNRGEYPAIGPAYVFSDQKFNITPAIITTLTDYFNNAVSGKLGAPDCPTMDATCSFQKTATMVYTPDAYGNGQGTMVITFDLNPVNKTAFLPLLGSVHADQAMGHYQVVVTMLDNGMLSDMTFQYVHNTVEGGNTPWYVLNAFVYSY